MNETVFGLLPVDLKSNFGKILIDKVFFFSIKLIVKMLESQLISL